MYRQGGKYPSSWDELRHFGPARGMRFDPHPEPEGVHPSVGVLYAATGPGTALAESFQSTRVIDRSRDGVAIVSWVPTRPLVLLDLSSGWPLVNGASASIQMGQKRDTQKWARAVHERMGDDVDGLWSLSSMTGEPMLTLFSRTKTIDAWPARPKLNHLLADTSVDAIVYDVSTKIGYEILA
ncbi:RES family NAD+ phosphorylase [Microbacterium arborescens]